jgi:pyruvate dehydrogenase E2 component (dihydrolipoamide acetyltransferase)
MTDKDKAEEHHFLIKSEGDQNPYYYWTIGDQSKPPLLLINGLCGTHKDLLPFAQGLSSSHFVIIPDLPGWGASPRLKEELTLKHYAQFLLALVDHLELKKVHVLGHCMGSCLGIELTHLAPERVKTLTLVSTPYLEGNFIQKIFVLCTHWEKKVPMFYSFLYFWRNKVISFISGLLILKYKSFKKIWRENVKAINTKVDTEIFKENWRSLMDFNFNKIKDLHLPIHLIYGSQDIMIEKKYAYGISRLVPHAALEFIPEAGHLPPVETPGTLVTVVQKYLNGLGE